MRTIPVAKPFWLDRLRIGDKPLRCPRCNASFSDVAVYPGLEKLYYCSVVCATANVKRESEIRTNGQGPV
jgi:hypothetical protein